MSNQGYNGDLPRVVHVLHAGRRACEIQPLLLAMETTIVVSHKRLKNVLPDSYFFIFQQLIGTIWFTKAV